MKYHKIIDQIKNDLSETDAWWAAPEYRGECEKYLINTLDYLQACADAAVCVWPEMATWDAGWEKLEEITGIPAKKMLGDNTYNYSARLTHDLDYIVADAADACWVAFKVHRGGDIRGNYTDYIIMCFDSRESWYEIEVDMGTTFDLVVDGVKYEITPHLCEWYDVRNTETGESTEIVPDEITDDAMRAAIRKWARGNK